MLNLCPKLFSKLIFLCSAIALLVACSGGGAQYSTPVAAPLPMATSSNVITLVADDWCPYNCSPASDHPGYVIELAKEIFEKAGYQLKYEYVPWARVVQGIEEGTYDGAVGAARGDIPSAVFPDEEQGSVLNSLFVRKGETWQYTGLDSFKKIRLGVIGGYYYSDEINAYLDANANSSTIDVARGEDAVAQCLKKLLENDIDVYIEDPNVAYYTANQIGLDKEKLALAGTIGDPLSIYIAFSAKKTEAKHWAEILSNGMKELRANGRLAEIMQRYGMKDWK